MSELQEALADAKSVSEQAVSRQQAAEKGLAEAQEVRRQVADLRKALDDRQTQLESIKACELISWKLCSSNILLPMYIVRILHASHYSRCGKHVCHWVFRVCISDSAVLMSKTSILMLNAFVCMWQVPVHHCLEIALTTPAYLNILHMFLVLCKT